MIIHGKYLGMREYIAETSKPIDINMPLSSAAEWKEDGFPPGKTQEVLPK